MLLSFQQASDVTKKYTLQCSGQWYSSQPLPIQFYVICPIVRPTLALKDLFLSPQSLATTTMKHMKHARRRHGACEALLVATMSNVFLHIVLVVLHSSSPFTFGISWFISQQARKAQYRSLLFHFCYTPNNQCDPHNFTSRPSPTSFYPWHKSLSLFFLRFQYTFTTLARWRMVPTDLFPSFIAGLLVPFARGVPISSWTTVHSSRHGFLCDRTTTHLYISLLPCDTVAFAPSFQRLLFHIFTATLTQNQRLSALFIFLSASGRTDHRSRRLAATHGYILRPNTNLYINWRPTAEIDLWFSANPTHICANVFPSFTLTFPPLLLYHCFPLGSSSNI